MLQTVATNWAKKSENLTAIMFEKYLKLGREEEIPIEYLAKIQPGVDKDILLDWLPEQQIRYPLVDMEKLLELPDQISENDITLPSNVDESAYPGFVSRNNEAESENKGESKQEGLWDSIQKWWKGVERKH
jgi:hypothetical protein